ncbi:MAG: MBL fold metallo-hydrolase [Dehalococcoidia bacterium]|nr:MAG: MBL fold metallo-hydrolase [Dehalococcoidia bacterium]
MEIMWLGHAAFRLRGRGQTIYIDPVEMEYCEAKAKHLFDSPEKADIILLTHHHTDHCNLDSFKRMRTPSTVIVGPQGCREKLPAVLHEVAPGDAVTIGGTTIRAVHAYNITRQRAPGTPFHPRGSGVGYVVTVDGQTVYHAGDTEPIPEMADIGGVDVALLPVDDQYTMSPEEAMQCAVTVKAKVVIPMHYFDTSLERVLEAARATPDVQVRAMTVGDVAKL